MRIIGILILLSLAGCSVLRPTTPAPPETPDHRATQTEIVSPAPTVAASGQAEVIASPVTTDDPTPTTNDSAGETPSPADVPQPAGAAITYTVQAGDTLWGIAMAHGVNLDVILTANAIENPNNIWAGQELIIPDASPVSAASTAPPTAAEPTPVVLATDDMPEHTPSNPISQPAVELEPLQDQALLEPMLHDWQKMNNCAPTTVSMALSYFNLMVTQFDTAPVLKGGPQDKNVSPPEIAGYLHDQGFGAIVRVNGDIDTLQQLVTNGIPVIVEQWLDRPDDELTGHYRLVRGYDRTAEEMIVNDSYSGPRLHFSYAEFDRLWRPFNRVFIPVYQPDSEPVVRAILGDAWDDASMYWRAAETAQSEIGTQGDAYAWFNLGNSLLGLAEYEAAAEAFDRAIEIGLPPRMFWYQFGAFEAYNQTGQFQRVLDVSAPLTGLALEELHYQRGIAYEGLGQPAEALAEYQRAAELNARFTKAAEAVARLTQPAGG